MVNNSLGFEKSFLIKRCFQPPLNKTVIKTAPAPLALITPDIRREMDYGSVMALQLNNAIVPKYMATMRLDTHKMLGIVTEDYGVVQNEDAFKFIDTLVTGKMADAAHTPVIETAGVLDDGKRDT